MDRFLDVDPRTLLAGTQRQAGADGMKLHQQIINHGTSLIGMPPIVVEEDPNGRLRITDGMTRATRAAMFHRGVLVTVVVRHLSKRPFSTRVTIGDLVP